MGRLLQDYTDISWLNTLLNALTSVVGPILVAASIAGVIYAVWVGIKFAKADSKEERQEAKQKLIYVIVAIVVTLLLVAIFYWFANNVNSIVNSNWFV